MNRTTRATTYVGVLFVALLTSRLSPAAPLEEKSVSKPLAIATLYYDALAGATDLAAVPLADRVRFTSPRFELDDAEAFRGALARLRPTVKGLEIEHQLHDEEFVLTVYKLDVGATQGPVPMAEKLHVVDGMIVDVELIFDSVRLGPPPSP